LHDESFTQPAKLSVKLRQLSTTLSGIFVKLVQFFQALERSATFLKFIAGIVFKELQFSQALLNDVLLSAIKYGIPVKDVQPDHAPV
jgi:hypothetical protein